ncbi:hypothetical protein [Mycoplasma suis]|uniref:Uncharacterized protein n=1 Tax=Mycoplasma suis (strain Illinois) TaxID=768700 RepID=F0QSA6_MYCSL|nr:hypothetical protein [Mycoplasma suis]ADX98376.1 Conserved hypothetical protein [Mycoplasma suis str. Illinois]
MNYLFFSKKLGLFSGYLNFFSSIGWILLIIAMGYYHYYIVNNPANSYYYSSLPSKSFFLNAFENLRQRTPVTSVQPTHQFASTFINSNGYGQFFSAETIKLFNSEVYFWSLVQPVFILSIITSSLNLFLSTITSFLSFKARSFNHLVCSVANLFIPIYGFLLTLKIYNKINLFRNENLNNSRVVSPGQWTKFRTKLFLSKIFSEVTIPA